MSKEKMRMNHLEERNQKIIDAIIDKANAVCPGSLALIGINGSFMTGDYHNKSDLDLLLLVNDDKWMHSIKRISLPQFYCQIM